MAPTATLEDAATCATALVPVAAEPDKARVIRELLCSQVRGGAAVAALLGAGQSESGSSDADGAGVAPHLASLLSTATSADTPAEACAHLFAALAGNDVARVEVHKGGEAAAKVLPVLCSAKTPPKVAQWAADLIGKGGGCRSDKLARDAAIVGLCRALSRGKDDGDDAGGGGDGQQTPPSASDAARGLARLARQRWSSPMKTGSDYNAGVLGCLERDADALQQVAEALGAAAERARDAEGGDEQVVASALNMASDLSVVLAGVTSMQSEKGKHNYSLVIDSGAVQALVATIEAAMGSSTLSEASAAATSAGDALHRIALADRGRDALGDGDAVAVLARAAVWRVDESVGSERAAVFAARALSHLCARKGAVTPVVSELAKDIAKGKRERLDVVG